MHTPQPQPIPRKVPPFRMPPPRRGDEDDDDDYVPPQPDESETLQ